MDESNQLAPRERTNGGAIEPVQARAPFLALDMLPREPRLIDYLIIVKKHQWLIISFLLAVVTIVTITTFRMQPVYEATARIEIDRENSNLTNITGNDADEIVEDMDNYIETQSKILMSETLALQTIRSLGLQNDPRYGGRPDKPIVLNTGSGQRSRRRARRFSGRFLGI